MEQSNSSLSHAGKDADAEKSPPNTVQNGLEQPKAPPPAPPDGGLQAWLVCLGTFCGYVATFGWLTCIGVFQDYYQQNFLSSYSPSAVAWIPSTQALMIFGGGLIFGKVFDSYGPRWPMLIGTFLQVFGLMMTSLSTKYYQIFLSQAIVSAVGASIIWPSFAASLLTWFQKKRSTAFGIATTGSSIGGVVFPIMVYRLIPQVGFPWTMRIVAFLLLALLGVTNLTVKSMLEHSPTPFTAKEYIVQLKDANFAVTVLGSAIFSFGLFVPFNFIILQAEHKGMSNHLAQYLVSILNAASLPGRVLPGFLADKFGRFHVLILTTMFSGILTLALWIPASSNATIITFTASYGFFSGAYVSLGPSVVAQISEISQIGLRNGLLYFFVGIAVLAGNPIAGALIDSDNGNYTKLQIFAGVMMIAGASLLLCARIMVAGWKWKVT